MATSKYRRLTLDPDRSALVLIDMENDFCKPGGTHYHPDGVDETIGPCAGLLEKCRQSGAQPIFVQSVRDPDSPEFTRFGNRPFILRHTWGSAYIDELAPRAGEPVIEKNTHDCFYRTKLDDLLAQRAILPETHSIIVIGVAANVCVYHAVIGFHVRHYNVVVPIDCCAGYAKGRKVLETQMQGPAYSYNVAVTKSTLITFERARAGESSRPASSRPAAPLPEKSL